uniref:CUE domain-containing protein n=1 Tax=Salix viminalis TaxID=40686 RepID=A0A6N2JZY4_SALVM
MGVSYLAISAVCTVLSFSVLTEVSLDILRSDGLSGENLTNLGNANRAVELLFESYATIALVVNFVFNVFLLLNLCLKVKWNCGLDSQLVIILISLLSFIDIALRVQVLLLNLQTIFFGELYPSETQKLVERLINYAIYKGTLLPLVIPPTISQTGLWSIWLTVQCFLKMFQALARDRLERLNASPSATPWTYFRAYSALLLVLSADLFWIQMCYVIYRSTGSSMFLLLFFEPFSFAFETMQLLEIWLHHSTGNSANCQRFKFFDAIRAGTSYTFILLYECQYPRLYQVIRNSFAISTALLSAIIKRIKGFIKLRIAFNALHAALPDATSEELRAYDDECAICRGLNEIYSCPICRKPFFVGRLENEANTLTREVLTDEQLAHQINEGFDRQNTPGRALLAGAFPTPIRNSTESSPWRSTGLDSIWLPTWSSQGADRAGPSTDMRSVGLGRVQMMMRHLASVGETYAQTALEDAAWSLWPMSPSQATPSASSTPSAAGGRHPGGTGGLHMRTASHPTNDYLANILAMAETVREVLPLVPDELILQDLQRTNSATVTVNNLLHM